MSAGRQCMCKIPGIPMLIYDIRNTNRSIHKGRKLSSQWEWRGSGLYGRGTPWWFRPLPSVVPLPPSQGSDETSSESLDTWQLIKIENYNKFIFAIWRVHWASACEHSPIETYNLDFLFNRLVHTGALSAKLTTGFWQNLNCVGRYHPPLMPWC